MDGDTEEGRQTLRVDMSEVEMILDNDTEEGRQTFRVDMSEVDSGC